MTLNTTHLASVTGSDYPTVAFANGLTGAVNNLKDNATDKSTGLFTSNTLDLNTTHASVTELGIQMWTAATTWVRFLWDQGAGSFKLLNQDGALQPLSLADGSDAHHAATYGQLTTTNTRIDTLVTVPTGAILEWPAASLPSGGYLWANGDAVSRTTYAALFALFGTTYGAGDGSSTFQLPDRRQRVSLGTGTMGGTSDPLRITVASTGGANSDTLGGLGGEETHTLSTSEMPSHSHGWSGPVSRGANAGTSTSTLWVGSLPAITDASGDGATHNNTQPWIALNFIIKT